MMPVVPNVELRSNSSHLVEAPQIGLGMLYIEKDTAQPLVEMAIDEGYRHFDTATMYGNEAGLGRALMASGLAREELFVTTKLWSDRQHDPVAAFHESLDRLGTGYIDLYLIHWPAPRLGLFPSAWEAINGLQEQGLVRAIGVSNFLEEHLSLLAGHSGMLPAVNQIEVHPRNQQTELRAFCDANGIVIEAHTPLGRGRALSIPALQRLARLKRKTVAQIALRWHIQNGHIVIPKASSREHLIANLGLFDFELTPYEMASIGNLDKAQRINPDPLVFEG